MSEAVPAIDAVVNIWTDEALRQRPGWGTDFFSGKMKADRDVVGKAISLEQMIEMLDEAGIERAFLIAARSGRPGLPGCYHMPYEIVARACEKYPKRFHGLAGIDPFDRHEGREGIRGRGEEPRLHRRASAIRTGSSCAPDHAKYYPFYAKCVELDVPIQMQVGQSMIYAPDFPCRSVGAADHARRGGLRLPGAQADRHPRRHSLDGRDDRDGLEAQERLHRLRRAPAEVLAGELRQYINSFGQDKVIFGTDFPILDFQAHHRRHRRARPQTRGTAEIFA